MTATTPNQGRVTSSQRGRAYAELRQMLQLQQVAQGERLREPDWAQRLGVGRAALREAFARLHAEGMLAAGQSGGYFVPTLTERDTAEVLAVRAALECCAIEAIGAADPPADLSPLDEACDDLEALISSDLLMGATEADRRFHDRLIAASDNGRLAAVYDRAPLPMLHDRVCRTDAWRDECRQSLKDHRRITDLLRRRETRKAITAMRRHLDGRWLLPRPARAPGSAPGS